MTQESTAALDHHREQRVQDGRLRRGADALDPLVADPRLDRADQAGACGRAPRSAELSRYAVVVLPLVPVTPNIRSARSPVP